MSNDDVAAGIAGARRIAPETLPAWQLLGDLARRQVQTPLAARLGDGDRFRSLSLRVGPLVVDFSKQHIDAETISALLTLAEQSAIESAMDDLFDGKHVNWTENRPAWHVALRAPATARPPQVAPAIAAAEQQMLRFAEGVRNGTLRGADDRPFSHVLHIGIGGSHLGPEVVVDALHSRSVVGPEIRFLANIDGHALRAALDGLDPSRTLVVVVSKSFGTFETLLNAGALRSWFMERGISSEAGLARHFVAVTANVEAARTLGVAPDRCLPMWDWVGGRYSVWSAVGLPIALRFGVSTFRELLAGAHTVDQHFRSARPQLNAPLLLALIGIWNSNFLGATSHAVLAYDWRLRGLMPFLQQLEMESNGKSTRRDGGRSGVHTAPVVWGGEETNAQHAFHQLLLQGTRAFSADFVAAASVDDYRSEHHRWMLANCLAQSRAMALGSGEAPAEDDIAAAHRWVSGNHASTTILLDQLNAESLGALLALYEHKVFCQGCIWQINSFDQWGVELGKRMAMDIEPNLRRQTPIDAAPPADASTRGLVDEIRSRTNLR